MLTVWCTKGKLMSVGCIQCSPGHFKYLIKPFRLIIAPAILQALVNDVLRVFLNNFVFVYFYNFLIFSRDLIQHKENVMKVLEHL